VVCVLILVVPIAEKKKGDDVQQRKNKGGRTEEKKKLLCKPGEKQKNVGDKRTTRIALANHQIQLQCGGVCIVEEVILVVLFLFCLWFKSVGEGISSSRHKKKAREKGYYPEEKIQGEPVRDKQRTEKRKKTYSFTVSDIDRLNPFQNIVTR